MHSVVTNIYCSWLNLLLLIVKYVSFVYNTLKSQLSVFSLQNCKKVLKRYRRLDFNNIVLSNLNKLFGFYKKSIVFQFLNNSVLSARFLIYRCKDSNSKPYMLPYFNFSYITKQSEHIIAKQNNKVDEYFRKWCFISAHT